MARNPFKGLTGRDWKTYRDHHYGEPLPADLRLASWTATTLQDPRVRKDHGSVVEIGNAGVFRTLPLVAGNLAVGARVVVADAFWPQRRAARQELRVIRRGRGPTVWDAHLNAIVQGRPDIARVEPHPYLEGALGKMVARASVRKYDLRRGPLGRAGIRIAPFVLGSWTSDPAEFRLGLDHFYAGMRPGDVAIIHEDAEATGYSIGQRRLPNFPTTEAELREDAEARGLIVIGSTTEPIEDYGGEAAGSTFTGFIGLVVKHPEAGDPDAL